MPNFAQADDTYDFSKEDEVTQTIEEKNKAFVLEAFETSLCQKGTSPLRSVSGLRTTFNTVRTFRPDARDSST
jgi:hypothetical protein